MKFGQRYSGNGHVSIHADYVQFNICGLSAIDIVQRYFLYEINKPIVLLGDYTSIKRNASEDDMLSAERLFEIKDTIKSLQAFGADILAITFSPVSREGIKKLGLGINFIDFVNKLNEIYPIPVLIKNRSSKELFLSSPEEIIEFSKQVKISLDILELYEMCNQDTDEINKLINKLNIDNIKEMQIRYPKDLYEKLNAENTRNYIKGIMNLIEFADGKVPLMTFGFGENSNHPMFDTVIKKVIRNLGDSR